MGGLPGAPEGGPGGEAELKDIGELTAWFPSAPGGTFGTPEDEGFYPWNCCGGTI